MREGKERSNMGRHGALKEAPTREGHLSLSSAGDVGQRLPGLFLQSG